MTHAVGAYLGGVRTLADIRSRCVVDCAAEGGCWHLRKADGRRMVQGSGPMRIFVHGRGSCSARRAAWELAQGALVDRGFVVSGVCGTWDCINPAHARCWTKRDEGAHIAATGAQRGHPHRARVNTAIGRKSAKLTPELAQWARESSQPLMAVAHALGVRASRVAAIRAGMAWRSDAPTASVFAWGSLGPMTARQGAA